MNTSSINNYYNNNVASALSSALQTTGSAVNKSAVGNNSTGALSGSDSSQLSPFAQLLSVLQQLQQSNPTQYQQVTKQIATNLQNAAQTATSNGNTAQASQLTQLAKDFTNASTSGQLPNVQDLAQTISGGGHHHHSHAQSSTDADGGSSSTSGTVNPMSIIMNTLSQAGVSATNS
jgi:hypothetical protein